MDFQEAFVLWRGLGVSYEFGVLDNAARVTIHMMHRLGAIVVLLYIGWLAWSAIRNKASIAVHTTGIAIAILLLLQIGLGIANGKPAAWGFLWCKVTFLKKCCALCT